jgi:flagellar basal body-associated protein FliL
MGTRAGSDVAQDKAKGEGKDKVGVVVVVAVVVLLVVVVVVVVMMMMQAFAREDNWRDGGGPAAIWGVRGVEATALPHGSN